MLENDYEKRIYQRMKIEIQMAKAEANQKEIK